MEQHVNYLDTLTEPQQLQVYELMAIGDIEDGNIAAKIYIDCNYDLNRAIQRWLDQQAGPGMSHNTPGTINPINNSVPEYPNFVDFQEPVRNQQRARNPRSELHTQYRRHIERKAREEEERSLGESFKMAVGGVVSGFKSIWNAIMPIAIRGETAGGEQFLTYFKKHYSGLAKQLKFSAGTFESNVWHSHATKLPLLVYLHIDGSVFRSIPSNVFRSKNLVDFMNNKFHLLGLLMNTEESQKLTKYIETKHCPCLGIFRANLFDEIVLVEYITLTNETIPEQVLEHLKGLERNHYTLTTEEDTIRHEVQRGIHAQRVRNSPYMVQDDYQGDFDNSQMFPLYGGAQPQQPPRPQRSAEEQQRLEEARILRQIQEEEFKEVERKILEQQQKQADEERLRKEKEEEEKIAQQQREEEQRRKEEEKELQKKLKSQALPEEPAEGDASAVLVIFRLPDGGRMERRFRNTDLAQSMYDFVDTKDIQFDSTTVRYDLMQPRPFLCLDEKEKTIGEYFEGSNHEVIHVRELTA